MTAAQTTRPRLPSLTGLRFPAALAVFGLHVVQRLSPGTVHDMADFVAGRGYIGVSFFFVLSGFVLTWTARPGDGARSFYGRRFARIAPSYLACLIGTWLLVIVATGSLSGRLLSTIPSLLAIQAWFPDPGLHFAINPPGWSIAAEAFFYACFPLLVPLLTTTRGRAGLLGMGLALVSLPAAALRPDTDDTQHWELWATYILPVPRLGEFVLGMLVAHAVLQGWRPRLSLMTCLWLLVACYAGTALLPVWATISLVTLVPIVLVLAAAAAADLTGQSTVWARPWAQKLGEWSFAFYLVQEACFRVQDEVQDRWGTGVGTEVPSLALTLVVTVVAASVIHRWIERPWEARLRPRRRVSTSADREPGISTES